MAHDINGWMQRLRRQFERGDKAANVMAQPVAWAEVNDLHPATTWEEGRQATVKHLRELARKANEIADYAEALAPYRRLPDDTGGRSAMDLTDPDNIP